MTSHFTSCPKLLNRKFTKKKRSAPLLLSPSTIRRLHIYHVQYESPRYYQHLSCPLFSIMGSAATPVIPFRESIHGTGLIQIYAHQLTCSYTKRHACTHLHIYTTARGNGVGCWLKGDKENSGMQRREERLRGKKMRWRSSTASSTQLNLAPWGVCAFKVCVYTRACLSWCNAEISNPITVQTNLAA